MTETDAPASLLFGALLALTLASAYFASSETAMMALNRYRLLHLVKQGRRGPKKAHRLLRRPDRLLGVILIGNNLVNFAAATVFTFIWIRYLGESTTWLAPVALTLWFLIFAEVGPKTVAAARPEQIAFPSAYLLQPLLRLLHPAVAFVNAIANFLVKPFVGREESSVRLSVEELRTVVHEGAGLLARRQDMLLRILDLEKVMVEDIMVPRSEIDGIDIDESNAEIAEQILSSQHTRLPVLSEQDNRVHGVLHLRRAARFLRKEAFTPEDVLQEVEPPYFVPAGTPLHTQLANFQKEKHRIALVVDEYGDIQGIVTLEDILEEIVGEFTTDFAANAPDIHPQPDGSFFIDGTALLRDVNRALSWSLPVGGPRTLNGLVLEHLEFIPESNVCMRVGDYLIETLQIKDNVVRTAKVSRAAPAQSEATSEEDEEDDDDGAEREQPAQAAPP